MNKMTSTCSSLIVLTVKSLGRKMSGQEPYTQGEVYQSIFSRITAGISSFIYTNKEEIRPPREKGSSFINYSQISIIIFNQRLKLMSTNCQTIERRRALSVMSN